MSLKDDLKDNDSEDSLISQFETTLTIRSTANDYEDDVSMAHSTFYNHSGYMRDQTIPIYEEDEDDDDEVIHPAEIIQFKGKRTNRLKTTSASRSSSNSRSSKSPSPPPIPELIWEETQKYEKILKPSSLIDTSLSKFTNTFSDFLKSNPQIERDSPKFRKESDRTLVVLSPYSAEHAFGRKWVTKSYLATIFERPQRLLASCIGIAAALTMYPFFYKIVNSTKRGSIFSSHVLKIHGKNWPRKLYELCLESHEKLAEGNLEVPEDWNTGDIYLIPKTINAIEGVIGAIETGIDSLFKQNYNLSFIVIRPPGHHSHACLPSGFCLLNNVQIGIEYAFENYDVSHVAILDIDLHHGDGSQDICWERAGFTGDYGKDEDEDLELGFEPRDEYGKRFARYPKVGYFSLHDVKSYPTELGYATKENIKNASTCIMDHDLNIWNVHLQEWEDEDEFYKHYKTKYVSILNRVNQFLNQAKKQHELEFQQYLINKKNGSLNSNSKDKPPMAFKPMIVISAGFDASEYENPQMQRHGINVPTSFYSKFTNDAVKLSKIHNSKLISFLEGGYSDGALTTGIFSHLIGLTNSVNAHMEGDKVDSNLWNSTWGSDFVMKELTKGCKKNWMPYKQPKTDVTIWANEAIKLGRSMMPNAVLPNNYIYQYKEEGAGDIPNRMVKDLIDADTRINEDGGPRHTRSYLKKLALAQQKE
ncbi:hypothetical protein CANTEDRAFT_126474 [Yamadazyma tenuis ATCC 10573]|uniref:Histone deacetylase domain-containing protein n=1 Tax=Candida tenuis (strain ATCC 10573 / BCRC 21748 / CBS 615 / JCM 9827 / NBRC 10315 / NRRL Y-1498 / VKM Y-70) TaxID=590646 RepID=G3B947_CANTC|nr:uncharacterized protein CANTEDRAFT_126474 [Yamadazyma tenuis ATCC 10573]EGV62459.1 hypothetical protein CANTEDRAFT_126474 [Yamadazyma tenuis ATCC 10573]